MANEDPKQHGERRGVDMEQQVASVETQSPPVDPAYEQASNRARRTAFVARFIVLRESKRTRAHRVIELMEWDDRTTAEELAERFRQVFRENGDNMMPVERDIRRALAHSSRSLNYFVKEYNSRATLTFIESLFDYERSNTLLFGADEQPKPGGWRLPKELLKDKAKAKAPTPPKGQ